MDFKIDTKDTYSAITPVNNRLSAILAASLSDKCREMRQKGSCNFIIDLRNSTGMDPEALPIMIEMHDESYENDQSLVYTGLNEAIMAILKEDETDLLINIAPTMKEAIDIISMEILERDLLGEE
jgi:anti-anti-sigma regulatory factor